MLKKRIIPCLDIRDGRTVKGVNFLAIRDAGDPVALAKAYAEQGADELVFLDITATIEGRKTFIEVVEKVGLVLDIPFTVGGGISSREDVTNLLQAGADKVSINSAAVNRPELIDQLAQSFGNQCIVLAIDAIKENGVWKVCINGGRTPTQLNPAFWAAEAEERGAGEILLTSMRRDGTKVGFDAELIGLVADGCRLPLIASGGAGTKDHFTDLFQQTDADAALAASIFHFGEISVSELKSYLKTQNIPLR